MRLCSCSQCGPFSNVAVQIRLPAASDCKPQQHRQTIVNLSTACLLYQYLDPFLLPSLFSFLGFPFPWVLCGYFSFSLSWLPSLPPPFPSLAGLVQFPTGSFRAFNQVGRYFLFLYGGRVWLHHRVCTYVGVDERVLQQYGVQKKRNAALHAQ